MRERRGDIWDQAYGGLNLPGQEPVWLVIPTNGVLNSAGRAIMGAGLARAAVERFPGLPERLGTEIRARGNAVHDLGLSLLPGTGAEEWRLRRLIAFPTKQHWRGFSSLDLIERSARQLVEMVEAQDSGRSLPPSVLLPRVGTGLGGLPWSKVKPVLARHLTHERFVVV